MPTRAWACVVVCASAWALPSISAFTLPRSDTSSFRLSTAFSGDETDRPESQSFSTKQDWALIDAVPLFTVSAETDQPATFWTQLAADRPELSLLSPERLQARYEELQQPATNPFGPQPPVLDQWSYSEDGKKVVGVLAASSGSTLWFPVAARGWLKDDPLAVQQSPADTRPSRETRGGWVVALGGAVYELGVPAADGAPSDGPLAPMARKIFPAVANGLATLVAVAGLSATLGFAAGSGSHPFGYRIPPSAPGIVVAPNRVREATTVQKYGPDSIAERRVSAERRVAGRELQLVRETESAVRTESKIRVDRSLLEKDQAGLEKLQQIQNVKGEEAFIIDLNLGSTSATPTNPDDLTIAQQRAQQERRVTGRELQLVRKTERVVQMESKMRVSKAVLEQDRAGLEKIRRLESEKGGDAVVLGQIL